MPSYDHILSVSFFGPLITQTMNPSTLLKRQYLRAERFKLNLLDCLLLSLFVLTFEIIDKILSRFFLWFSLCLCILLKLLSQNAIFLLIIILLGKIALLFRTVEAQAWLSEFREFIVSIYLRSQVSQVDFHHCVRFYFLKFGLLLPTELVRIYHFHQLDVALLALLLQLKRDL